MTDERISTGEYSEDRVSRAMFKMNLHSNFKKEGGKTFEYGNGETFVMGPHDPWNRTALKLEERRRKENKTAKRINENIWEGR